MTDLLAVVERAKDDPLHGEEYLARETIGDEGDDPSAPARRRRRALVQPSQARRRRLPSGAALRGRERLRGARGSRSCGRRSPGARRRRAESRAAPRGLPCRPRPVHRQPAPRARPRRPRERRSSRPGAGPRTGRRSDPPSRARAASRPNRPRAGSAAALRLRAGSGRRRCRGAAPSPAAAAGSPDERGDALLEPAHRAGALARDQDPLAPALAQDAVEPVGAPDREQVDHAAAADVDHVLGQQVLADVDRSLPRRNSEIARRARSRARRTRGGSSRSGPRGRRSRSAAGRSAARAESASSTIRSQIASLPLRRLNSCPPQDQDASAGLIPGLRRDGATSAQRRGRGDRSRAEVAGRQPRLAHQRPAPLEPVGPRLGPRGDDLDQLVADEAQRRAVLGRVARGHAVEQVLVEGRAPSPSQ